MKVSIVIVAIVVAQVAAWSDELTPDQLTMAVDSEDTVVLGGWLTPEKLTSDDSLREVANLFLQALTGRKAKIAAFMLQAGLQLHTIESDSLDQAVFDTAVAGDEEMLGVLQNYGWTPQLAFASNLSGQASDSELGYVETNQPARKLLMERLISLSLEERNVRFLRLCLETGLSSNFRLASVGDESLLNQSVKLPSLPAFKLLIERGASLTEVRDIDQFKTTLALAIELHGEKSPFVALLKQNGADRLRYTKLKPNIAESTTDRLRVRGLPALSAPIIGYLMKGDVVELLEVTPLSSLIDGITAPWIRIRQGKIQGWVFGGYLISFEPDGQS